MRHLIFCLLGFMVLCPVAMAKDIYVDHLQGDDRANGFSEREIDVHSGPVRTIGQALRIAQPGDRIILAAHDQPYREMISLSGPRHQGTADRPFTILGNGAVLDGTRPVPESAWQHVEGDRFAFTPHRLRSQLLYLDGKPALRGQPASGDPADLQADHWMLWNRQVHFRGDGKKIPAEYDLRATAFQTGITLYHVRHVRIVDLVVQGFTLDGINAHDGVAHCTLSGVTSRGNGRSGISIGGSSRVVLKDCLVGDNGQAQVRTTGFCMAMLHRSQIVDNTAPAFDVAGGRLFVDGRLERDDD